MNSPETRFARTGDGTRIAYQTLGPGPLDVLSLEAYFSDIEHGWTLAPNAHVHRRLSELGRLILFDGRGTGRSDRLAGERLPTLEERVDDAIAVLDEVRSERAAVIAYADSGPLGCLFAATHPDRTESLILCNSRPRTAWAPDYPWGTTPEELDREAASTLTQWGTWEEAAAIVAEAMPDSSGDESLIEWWAEEMRRSATPKEAVALLQMFYEMDVRDILPAIHVPCLVLSSEGIIADESAAMANRIPGSKHIRIPGTSPTMIGGDVDGFTDEIMAFIRAVEADEGVMDTVLATLLFTDIVGSTTLAADLGNRAWKDLLERHHAYVRGVLGRFRGREIDTVGDGFFAIFDGPARAIRCARTIVDGVRTFGIHVRAGLHTGECEVIDRKVAGIAVSVGARVASLAGPSEVLVSQTVKDLVAGSGLAFGDAGEHELKGLPDRWQLYRVVG